MSTAVTMRYRTVTAAVRYRGVRAIHVQEVETWTDDQGNSHYDPPPLALCGVRAGDLAFSEEDGQNIAPGDATCRRCRQLWRSALRASGPSEEEERREALRMIGSHLAEWQDAGALDYVLPSEPPGRWRIGVLRGTSADPGPDIIALNTIEEALAFLEGVVVVAQWTVRTRKKGAW